jgi:hypothetical protein
MALSKRQKYIALATLVALSATGIVATIPQTELASASARVDPVSIMRISSPGSRLAGARTNKLFSASLPTAERGPQLGSLPPPPPALGGTVVAPIPESAVLASAVPAPVPVQASPVASGPIAASHAPDLGFLPVIAGLGGVSAIIAAGDDGGSDSFAPATPEPSTWLMMIAGFGFLGLVLRRRRRKLMEPCLATPC